MAHPGHGIGRDIVEQRIGFDNAQRCQAILAFVFLRDRAAKEGGDELLPITDTENRFAKVGQHRLGNPGRIGLTYAAGAARENDAIKML